ncbi:MAG: hypothetical protein AAFR65_04010 [Pseudomonadota bacterium]
MRIGLIVLLLIGGLAYDRDRLLQRHFGGTSRDVLYFSPGRTPDICGARFAKNVTSIEDDVFELVRMMDEDEIIEGYFPDYRYPWLEGMPFAVEAEPITIGDAEFNLVKDIPSEARKELYSDVAAEILGKKVLYRPWKLKREADGSLEILFDPVCGWTPGTWIAWRGVHSTPPIGPPVAHLSLVRDSDSHKQPCPDEIDIEPGGYTKCTYRYSDEWLLVQKWIRYPYLKKLDEI